MEINKQQFIQIIESNDARLKHLCRVYAADKADEKDLYQEIIIKVWQSLHQFKGNAKISTWIYRVALNVSISYVRKQQTRQKHYRVYRREKQTKPNFNYGSDKRGERKIDRLYNAINQLNASEKAIITMYLEDFSYTDIAKVIQITENYVGVKLNRIKKKLTKIIDKEYGI